jgi:hypothetical protein
MDVWFSIKEEPPPRGAKSGWRNLKTFVSAPPERLRRAFALLTRTYHGRRQTGSPQAGPKVAAILSVVESCRRLKLPVRDYFSAILPGLADLPIRRLPELTPKAWVSSS